MLNFIGNKKKLKHSYVNVNSNLGSIPKESFTYILYSVKYIKEYWKWISLTDL